MEGFPGERASTPSDDVARHGEKLVKRYFCAVKERVSDLTYPAGVRVRGRLVGFVKSGRGGVQIGLHIMVRGVVGKVFGEGGCIRVVVKTKRGGAD